MRFLLALLIGLGWALPASAQPRDDTGTVEHIIKMFTDHTSKEEKFVVLENGTRLRIKGVNTLKHGDKVKVKRVKIRKPEKAKENPELTEAEIDVPDLYDVQVAAEIVLTTAPLYVAPAYYVGGVPGTPPSILQSGSYSQVVATFKANSYGKFTFAPLVHPWVAITPPTITGCDYYGMGQRVKTALAAIGVTLPTSGYTQYLLPSGGGCSGIGGLAYVGGNTSYVFGTPNSAGHELGHNLGFQHSKFQSLSPTSAQLYEYGNHYCIMGDRHYGQHFAPALKIQMGWLVPTDITGKYGTHALTPYETTPSALQIVTQPPGSFVQTKYYVEARTVGLGIGHVLVTRYTLLMDTLPLVTEQKQYLSAGQSFTLDSGEVITNLASGATGASIGFAKAGDPPPPPPPPSEVCDGIDNNHDGVIDEGCPSKPEGGTAFDLGCFSGKLTTYLGDAVGGSAAAKLSNAFAKCAAVPQKFCAFENTRAIYASDTLTLTKYTGTCAYMGAGGVSHVWQVK